MASLSLDEALLPFACKMLNSKCSRGDASIVVSV